MFLKDLAKVLCSYDGSALSDMTVTVKTYNETHDYLERVLWTGKAKDLLNWAVQYNWIVVEYLIDPTTDVERIPGLKTPLYNRGRIISVM